MSIDVADWLRRLGLEQYAPGFSANDVDTEVLLELMADDLIGLGVTSIGHGAIESARWHRQRTGRRRRPDRRWRRTGARGCWRDTEPRRASAGASPTGHARHCRQHAAADRRSVRDRGSGNTETR